jgi:hypothetical protein
VLLVFADVSNKVLGSVSERLLKWDFASMGSTVPNRKRASQPASLEDQDCVAASLSAGAMKEVRGSGQRLQNKNLDGQLTSDGPKFTKRMLTP